MSHVLRVALRMLCTAAAALSPAITVVAEAADEAVRIHELDQIVVTATRHAERAFETPYAVNVRDLAELQEHLQVRTIPDALRDLPGIMIQKTTHGQGSPYIRGFTGLRTLFLVDGVRLNNSTFREGPNQYWNTVDPLSAYRLEVVKGPTSVLYGSDAIGGTVNAISRSYRDLGWAGGFQSRLYARAASAEESLVLRPEIALGTGRFDVIAGVSLKDFGDLHGGRALGDQPMTGYDELDGDLKLHYDLADNQRLVAALQHVSQDDAWRVHRTVFGRSWEGTTVGNERRRSMDQVRTLAYVQYLASDLAPWMQEMKLSLSHHRQDEERTRIRDDGRTDIQGVDVGTTGFFGHFVVPSGFGTWTAGAELYHDAVDSFRRDYHADGTLRSIGIQGPVADDAAYDTAAAFLQDQLSVGERTDLVFGLRFTHARADADAVEDPLTGARIGIEKDWSATTASLRFTHRLDEAGRRLLFGGISQGFRAPNLSDLTRLDTARSNEIETPVFDLDAEDFLTYELGAKWAGARWQGQAALYYTSVEDMVIRTPTGAVIDGNNEVTKRNSGDGYVTGIELQGRYALSPEWALFGGFSWMDGEVDTYPTSAPLLVREPLDRLMPLSANAGAHWAPAGEPWWMEAYVSHAARQDELSTRDAGDTDRIPPGGTPAYAVLTLRGGWQLSERLQLAMALENVSDEDYRVHGSGVNEAGRNLVVSLIWQP